MNERLNIQGLIDMLAEKHGMDRKDAESFVKEFFQLIEESLEKDKYVKIRGLGTFKLINVGSRESVKVNTGERFEIQRHTKVSFTPESALKGIINRPFSHFETVVLNDTTVFEDTLVESDEEDEEEVAVPEVVSEEEKSEEPTPVVIPEETVPPEPEQSELEKKEVTETSTMKYFIGVVALVVLLCGGAVIFMYYPDWFDEFAARPLAEKISDPDASRTIVEEANIPESEDDILTDSIVSEEVVGASREDSIADTATVILTPKEEPKENTPPQPSIPKNKKERKKVAVPFEPDSVGYTIVGTETTYTVKEGETLTRIALRFYGTKALWPYIVKHNPGVIKNPDNVPYGTTIKIPKLAKKQ